MSKEQLVTRLVAGEARINKPRRDSGNLSDEEWGRLSKALGPLTELPLHIDDQRGLDELTLSAKVRQLVMKTGLELVIVDYIGLMKSTRDFRNNRVQEVAHISQALKALAGEMKLPIIAMAQVNRDPEKREDKRPLMSDLRESGSLEQDADVVMLMFRPDYYQRDKSQHNNIAEVNIAKHRNGATGTVKLRFHRDQTRFEDLASHYSQDDIPF
jgi:replicative DNA helicase